MLLLGGSEAMKNRKKLAILLPVIVIAAALAYNSIQDRSRNDPNIIRVSGNIEVTDAELSFKISGRVGERLVSEGETIEAGQTVARLESDELTQEVALRNTEVRATEAALAELEAGARPEEVAQAEASVRHAQARLDKLLAGSRFQEVAALLELWPALFAIFPKTPRFQFLLYSFCRECLDLLLLCSPLLHQNFLHQLVHRLKQ